jgi:hypothetical protein
MQFLIVFYSCCTLGAKDRIQPVRFCIEDTQIDSSHVVFWKAFAEQVDYGV